LEVLRSSTAGNKTYFFVEGTFSHFDTEALQGTGPGLTALLYAAEGQAPHDFFVMTLIILGRCFKLGWG
jgi:cellulose synthase/poly-beta-1,6-N-acetylglucosamine synthase-like glycosyltransferase